MNHFNVEEKKAKRNSIIIIVATHLYLSNSFQIEAYRIVIVVTLFYVSKFIEMFIMREILIHRVALIFRMRSIFASCENIERSF